MMIIWLFYVDLNELEDSMHLRLIVKILSCRMFELLSNFRSFRYIT